MLPSMSSSDLCYVGTRDVFFGSRLQKHAVELVTNFESSICSLVLTSVSFGSSVHRVARCDVGKEQFFSGVLPWDVLTNLYTHLLLLV